MFQLPIPTSIILLLGLTAATCVIAYWSDNLGKKLGKKRITLQIGRFSLRPRQTATLITMLSSVGIMLVTLAVLMIFSKQVRNAILRADRLNKSNIELRRANELLAKQSTELKASVAQSDAEAQQAAKSAQVATQKANTATKNANARVAAASAKTVQAEKQFRDARGKLGIAQAARTDAEQGERTARRDEKTARVRAQQIVQRLSLAQGLVYAAQKRLTGARTRLALVNNRLATEQAGLQRAREAIARVKLGTKAVLESNRRLIDQLETGRASVKNLQGERVKLESEVAQARQYLTQFASLAEYYRKTTAQLGFGRVIVELGQVFGEIVVPRGADRNELREALARLLEEGAVAATKLGAQPYPDAVSGTVRALHLEPLPASILGGDAQDDALLGEAQIIDHFVNYLATFKVPVSVRLTASRRYAEGETQFEARLVPVPVELAFKRGATLAEATIDGSQSDARIFNQLLALVNSGGAQARDKGMVPLLSEQNPDFFAPGTNEQIFEFLRKLKARDDKTRVRLVAAEDLLTIDNPSVRFVIESSE